MGWGGGAGLVLKLLPLPLQGLPSLGKLPVGDTEILSAHWLSGLTQVQSGPICCWWPWLWGCVCGSEGPGSVSLAGLSPRTAMTLFGFSSGPCRSHCDLPYRASETASIFLTYPLRAKGNRAEDPPQTHHVPGASLPWLNCLSSDSWSRHDLCVPTETPKLSLSLYVHHQWGQGSQHPSKHLAWAVWLLPPSKGLARCHLHTWFYRCPQFDLKVRVTVQGEEVNYPPTNSYLPSPTCLPTWSQGRAVMLVGTLLGSPRVRENLALIADSL